MVNTIRNNPVIRSEFIGFLRRGRSFLLMFFILMVGAISLCTAWQIPSNAFVPLGRRLFFTVLGAEITIIFLILPGFVAHSLIVERDQNTLSSLLTTPLGSGKIIVGKLVSTMGGMLLLIISTFPLISICLARGGVSPRELILGGIAVISVCFIVSCFAIYLALDSTSTLRAVLQTHCSLVLYYLLGGMAVIFAIGILFGIAEVIFQLSGIKINNPLILHYGIALPIFLFLVLWMPLWMLYSACKQLRFIEARVRYSWEMDQSPFFQFGQEARSSKKKKEPTSWWRYHDGSNPFYLRERMGFLAARHPFSIPSWYILIIISHFLFLGAMVQEGRWIAIISLLGAAQMAPIFAAPLFAGEREHHTWELLVTAVERMKQLLDGKLKEAVRLSSIRIGALFFPPFLLALFCSFIIQLMVGKEALDSALVSLPHIALYIPIILTHTIFIITLTAFFSALFEKTNRVMGWSYTIVLFYFFAPLSLPLIQFAHAQSLLEVIARFISPVYLLASVPENLVVRVSLFMPPQWEEEWFSQMIGQIGFYAFATFVFYRLTLWILRKERQ